MSRKLVLLMTLIVLIGLSGGVFKVQRVKAGGTIYIRASGSVDPPTASIQRDGTLYTFTDKIFDEIVIEKDNIVVDGASYSVQGTGSGIGIDLSGRSNVTIKNMEIKAFGYGVYLSESSNINVYGNNITNNHEGIELPHSLNNHIYRNNITHNNHYGMRFGYSSNNHIYRNNITHNNHYGIRFGSSSNNHIYRNNITHNNQGIMLYHFSNNNSIYGNNIKINAHYGIRLDSSGNFVCHNNFINNAVQVYTENSVNAWDDGYPTGGNYWSNYTGFDSDHDGIGDSSHVIDENNQDNYPLINMFSSFNTSLGYYVNVISNSTIEDIEYFESNSTIRMYVSALEGIGFCRVRIPHMLINANNISVIIDNGLTPVLYHNYTLYDNGTHRWIYFTYEHPMHEVDIIPELPSFLILPLFMIVTLLAVIVYRYSQS